MRAFPFKNNNFNHLESQRVPLTTTPDNKKHLQKRQKHMGESKGWKRKKEKFLRDVTKMQAEWESN